MGNESTIMVELIVDDKGTVKIKQFERAADQALGQTEGKARAAGTAIGGLPVPIGRVGTALGPIAGLVAGAFSVSVITEFGRAAVQAASDLEEVRSKFNVVFSAQRTLAGGWAEELHDNYLMSTRAAQDYLASMMDLLGPMGVASDKAAALSFEITKLGADLASFNNRDQDEVMENLRSALVGEYEAVRKFGIILNDTIVTNEAMRLGLAGTKDAVTAADKAQAAYNLMLKMSPNAIGDVERTTDSYANTTKRLEGNLEDLRASIGDRLMPVMKDLKAAMADLVQQWDDKLNPHSIGALQRQLDDLNEQIFTASQSTNSNYFEAIVPGLKAPTLANIIQERNRIYWELRKAQRMQAHDLDQQAPAEETPSPFGPPPGKPDKKSADVKSEYLGIVTDYNRRRVAIIQQADDEILSNTLAGYALQRTQAQRAYDEHLADLADGLNAQAYTWRQFDEANLKAGDAFNAKMAKIDEAERAENEKQDLESWQRLNATAEEQSGYLVTLSERTADAIEQNFSDLFFDAFTGKLDSLSDYAEAVFTSITRASSDVMGQMMKEMIFGTGKQGSGGFIKGVGEFFSFLSSGNSPFAEGGWINEPILGIGKSGRRYTLGERESELVIPRSKMGATQSVVQNQISLTIQAVDAASFVELAGRNPQAIIGPLMEELAGGNRSLRSAIRGSF